METKSLSYVKRYFRGSIQQDASNFSMLLCAILIHIAIDD